MAKSNSHKGEEPVSWVTVKGKHFPKWADGTIGWENGQEDEPSKSGKKKEASMTLGNGLRLTADVSNPNKNISEVERAKKVNREKQYANKKMYQHQKAVKEEQEKAQAIADAISQKTGIANRGTKTTFRNADDIYNEQKNIKGNTQEEATRREKLSKELSRTVVSGMKSGEVYKVPSGKGYEELRYLGSEIKNDRAYATFETPNKARTGIVKEGSDLYGIQPMKSSQPATTSRNSRYDTSRTATKGKNLYKGKSVSQLQSILKNLREGAAITGTSESTARQIAEIEQEIARRKK